MPVRPLLTGLSLLSLLVINTVLLILPLLILAVFKLIPWPVSHRLCTQGINVLAESWAKVTRFLFSLMTPTQWDVRIPTGLRRDRSYLILCNHQSWVDIPALLHATTGKVPFFKFFLKQELIWIPFLGLAFWALDYPFMKRYSKQTLARHPHLQGRDLELTQKACERFKNQSVSIVNYLEGTRFTLSKWQQQQSPYQHLLKPKAGGIALVLASLGPRLAGVLDMTIVYPQGSAPRFWQLLSGQVSKVIVDIEYRPLEPWLYEGDYPNDPKFRQQVQDWVNQLWHHKDQRIEHLLHHSNDHC
ncbi:1-acyl-sn-glycerol-3-phosphate acyltransferase [Azomonas agilis]|uniref:1-acyl-sn-glycerol-3-phosphate acyltransferase n=1 Tax=Azomonas agilis TaxID=116849 RepID=A0A562IKZ3_9GAMM|nr:acyltransferase [Azomonas agilis]TWH71274.1 1-acyl-sn-glycerol-3-phosphate acyltransferase [Azomonas agilis]